MTWNLYVDDLKDNHSYNIILGRDIMFKLIVYLRFSDNTVRGNGGMNKVCTPQIKYD